MKAEAVVFFFQPSIFDFRLPRGTAFARDAIKPVLSEAEGSAEVPDGPKSHRQGQRHQLFENQVRAGET